MDWKVLSKSGNSNDREHDITWGAEVPGGVLVRSVKVVDGHGHAGAGVPASSESSVFIPGNLMLVPWASRYKIADRAEEEARKKEEQTLNELNEIVKNSEQHREVIQKICRAASDSSYGGIRTEVFIERLGRIFDGEE